MNAELVHQVELLSQSSMQARTGDIASLAGLLEQCGTLRQVGELEGLPAVSRPAAALELHVKALIMDECGDDAVAMATLRAAVSTLQTAVQSGELPLPEAFPAQLDVGAWSLESDDAGVTGGGDPVGATGDDDSARVAEEDSAGGGAGAFALDSELLGEYLAEQRGRLEDIEGNLLALEKTADEAALADLRRALHTIKGDSGFLGLAQVARISHAAEGYLEVARFPYDLERLFALKDALSRAFEDLAGGSRLSAASEALLENVLRQLSEPVAGLELPPPASADSGEAAGAGANGAANGAADASAGPARDAAPANAEAEPVQAVAEAVAESVTEAAAEPAAAEPAAAAPAPRAAFFQLSGDETLLADFVTEAKEHLELASVQLLSLESDPTNEEAINCVFRAFHTVKGIAGFLQLEELAKLAHGTENLLDKVRRDQLQLGPAMLDLVFEALDWITRLIANVRTGLLGDGRVPTEPKLGPFLERVHAAQQGRMVPRDGGGGADEPNPHPHPGPVPGPAAVATGAANGEGAPSASAARKGGTRGEAAGARKPVELKETLRVDYDRLENLVDTIGELVLAEAMISQDEQLVSVHSEALGKKLHNLRQVSRKLQELGTTIRMVPISGTFQKMARLVRDLARKSGKPIEFVSQGDETELDRAYVDLIADPLVHMIRNAVDHGVEPPAERRRLGKPEGGRIELRAFHEGGNIHVEVRDDGQGLDPERIFAKALEKELVAEEDREQMTEAEIYNLIFLPGFSTAAQVTEVSGRGVGMDVVRRNITELRGQVQITSERHQGTLFKIILPLTLALIDGMLVQVGAERFIFPVLSVVESTRITREMVTNVVGKGEMISLRGRQLPLYRLGRLFSVPGAREELAEVLAVVVENDGRQFGILVDELVGIQQTVIKSLAHGMFETQGLSGGSIMANGTVGLIVDIPGLIRIGREPVAAGSAG